MVPPQLDEHHTFSLCPVEFGSFLCHPFAVETILKELHFLGLILLACTISISLFMISLIYDSKDPGFFGCLKKAKEIMPCPRVL